MGPPSSGGLAVAQVLKLIEPFDLGRGSAEAMNGKALHLIAEAEKLAFADRDTFIGDPDFVSAPAGLLNSGYLDTRRALIDPGTAMARPAAGAPPQTASWLYGSDETVEAAGTSHVSIVAGDGSVLAMTTTIEAVLAPIVGGGVPAQQRAHRLFLPALRPCRSAARQRGGPGKRPRSSMAPTIVFDEAGKPWARSARPAAAASSSTS
jgi:gamma-glutamyltranspeptidase/glutathione hydrolase